MAGFSGCGLADNLTPSVGGSFKATMSGAVGANNDKSDFSGTAISGSWAGGAASGILTMISTATSVTSFNTQSLTITLGSPTKLTVGQTFSVGGSQNGNMPYAVISYAETNGGDNSKTKGWESMLGGTAKIDSLAGSKVGLSVTAGAMKSSGAPATGTFLISGSGSIDSVSGL